MKRIDAPRRWRIAMVAACPFPANHGTPGAIRELSLALAGLGHEVHIITYPMGDAFDAPGIHVHRVPQGPLSSEIKIGPSWERMVLDVYLVPTLISVIRKHKLEVIHAHNYEATIAGAMAKWATGRPLVYNGINSMADELPTYGLGPKAVAALLGRALDHVVPRTADVSMLLSEELKDYLLSLGLRRESMVVVPPGITPADFECDDWEWVRRKHGLCANRPVVMYTGALERFQRLDLLIQAMPAVLREHPEATFMLVNNIPNAAAKRELEAMATDLGVAERLLIVESVGFSELPAYLAAADVTVIPRPTCPGFPIKLLNAMAAGKAIVSFEGSAKAICHGYNGYVARGERVDELAAGISLLLREPETRRMLGERARRSVESVYDWNTLAEGIVQVYAQVEARRRRGRAFTLDYSSLGPYFKREYRPRLASEGNTRPTTFLQPGPIEYPTFQEHRE